MAEQTRAAWEQIADRYDDYVTPTHFAIAQRGLQQIGIEPGMRLLDVAAGSGALAIAAARLGAEVLAVDLAPTMLARLRARADAAGLTVQTQQMDGHSLDLADDTFDIVASQYGVMLFTDVPQGVAEMIRVARPSGRVLLTVFGPPEQIEFEEFFNRVLQNAAPGVSAYPTGPPPQPFQISDPAKLRQTLTAAGLVDVDIHTVTETLHFTTGTEMWDWSINSHPLGIEVASELTHTQQDRLRQALDQLLRERAGGQGPAALTHPVLLGTGTKPSNDPADAEHQPTYQ